MQKSRCQRTAAGYRPHSEIFFKQMKALGAIAGICYSAADAITFIKEDFIAV